MIFYSKLLIIILKLNALSLNKCELYMNMSYLILVILYFYFLLLDDFIGEFLLRREFLLFVFERTIDLFKF